MARDRCEAPDTANLDGRLGVLQAFTERAERVAIDGQRRDVSGAPHGSMEEVHCSLCEGW